jgi:tetratricopeptide (TPR) repeat protein
VYEVKSYQTNSINPPALEVEQIAQNEKVWDRVESSFESLGRGEKRIAPAPVRMLEKKLHLGAVESEQVAVLKEWYSAALDGWGVELQRAGQLSAANRCFTRALDLNTNNWFALTNLYCNTNLQAGNKMAMSETANLAAQLGSMQRCSQLLNRFGPVDEPSFCFLLGDAFAKAGQLRQAIQQLERAAALSPEVPAPRLSLAVLYTRCRFDEKALKTINELRSDITKIPGAPKIETRLSLLEANVCLSQNNQAGARQIFQSLLQQHPDDADVNTGVLQAYLTMRDYTNAETIVSRLLEEKPGDLAALHVKSGILLQTGRAAEAIPVLNQILSVTNSVVAKLNRADAYFQMADYAAAEKEYLALEGVLPNPFLVNFGLGEIALHQHDTNQAVQRFTQCLSNAPPMSAEWKSVRARLDAITSPARKVKITAAK